MAMVKNEQAVLVFTDLVDSVKLQQHVGVAVYGRLKARHDALIKAAVGSCPGAGVVESTGDGFYLRFPTCSAAVEACLRFQHALAVEDSEDYKLRARIGIHSGEVFLHEAVANHFMGMAPSITARVMSLALPGQILVTEQVYHDAHQYVRQHPHIETLSNQPVLRWANHGEYLMKGEGLPIGIFEVGAVGIAPLQTPPSSEKARRVKGDIAQIHADDEHGPWDDNIIRRIGGLGLIAAIVVAAVCGWAMWRIYWGNSNSRKFVALPDPPRAVVGPAVSAPQGSPLKEYAIELTKLVCEKTNDLDGMDQITLDLRADNSATAIKYPTNFEGKPCVELKAGEEWLIGVKLTFKQDVVAVFDELDGLPGKIGQTKITPETIEQGIFKTEMKGRGMARQRYRVEWRLVE